MVIKRNNREILHWAMILAGANYVRSIGEIVNRRATYLGTSATTQTYLGTVKPRADTLPIFYFTSTKPYGPWIIINGTTR